MTGEADIVANYAALWGVSPATMGILFGFLVAIGIMIAVAWKFKEIEHNKEMAIGTFFIILFIESIFGLMNWILFMLLLLLFGIYEYYTNRNGGSG